MLGSGSCDLNAASPHFLFLPHLPSSIYILYFLFCILYFVFCISYFAFSDLLRLFFCFTGFLNQRAEEEQVCSAAYIVVIAFLRVTLCRTVHCTLSVFAEWCCNVYYGRRRLLQFSCNRFCFKSAMFSLPSCIVGSYRAVQPVSSH